MAVKGPIKQNILTKAAILEKVTDYDIYRLFCPTPFKLNQVFNSPMPGRRDDNASFVIGNKYGHITHFDFGDVRYKGDCFNFVEQIRMLDGEFENTLKLIDKEFGLGLSDAPIKDYKKEIITYQQPKIVKKPALIQVVVKKFTKEQLAYWNLYHQDISDLQELEIYNPSKIYLNRQIYPIKKTDLVFAYRYIIDGIDKWKIYRPFASKEEKWFPNNVPNNTMEGLDNIKCCINAFIGKSRKDYAVVRKVFPTCCAVQNEGLACFSEENINYLREESETQWLGYDADIPGKKASLEVTKQLGFKHINVPDSYLTENIKDFADLGRFHGLQAVENHFKLKGLIR